MLKNALKFIYEVYEGNDDASKWLDYYQAKINESIALIYAEVFLYQTAKMHM